MTPPATAVQCKLRAMQAVKGSCGLLLLLPLLVHAPAELSQSSTQAQYALRSPT